MQIYNPNNELFLDIDVNISSFSKDEIMNEDVLSLEFEMTDYLEVLVDSYCTFRNKRYYLLKDSDFTKNGERNYAYRLVMYTDASKSKDVKYGLATVTRNEGQLPKFDYAKKIEFNLTGKPIDFAQLWCDNMNIANGEDAWTVGDCIDAPMQTLDFNDQWCFDVLGQLSDAFETEWEIEGKTLHIRMVEKMKDSAFPLSYGLGNGLLKGISRVNYSDSKMINRLIMKGSDRNVVFTSYGDTNLHMKKNATLKYDGNYFSDEPEFIDSPNAIEYVTDANGSYVERSDRSGRTKEDSLDCTTIYPMHEGTITSVDPDNDLVFFDADNTINYYNLLIPGNTMQLIPQSGDLIGKEFDVNYNHANKRFTLKRIEGNNDVVYPSGNLIPRVGDKYAIFKIELPREYIDEAELTALKKCVKYLYENEVPQYTYSGQLDPIYAEEHWLEIGGYLEKGYFVHFSDSKFLPDGKDIRITQVEYPVNDEKHPKLTLSNKVTGKSFTNKQNKIDNNEQLVERSKEESIQYAKRRYRDTQETTEMLQKSLLSFSEGINPITVQTMQLIAGDPTLQFRFVNSKAEPINPISYNIIYDPVTKKLHCPAGILQHMTLGIDTITSSRAAREYFFWDMTEYLSPILDDPNKRYYLYAKCENTGNKTDGTGIFLLSETAIAMESEAEYYYFLVGLLNSEYEEERSFASMYGFTEVLPGRITTDKIVSSDGRNVLDLLNNALTLTNGLSGDNEQTLSWLDGLLGMTNATVKNSLKVDGSAIIAGFKFYNDRIESVKTITDPSTGTVYPALKIVGNSTEAIIELRSVVQRWTENDIPSTVMQTITINSATGEISSKSGTDNATLTSQGILSNRAGLDATDPASGFNIKASISGLGLGAMNKTAWGNNWAMVGVFGNAINSNSSNPAPAYGGWFNTLKANGMCVAAKTLIANATLSYMDFYVSCYNTSDITVTLPSNPYSGAMYIVKRMNSAKVTVYGNGKNIMNNTAYPFMEIYDAAGDSGIFIYDDVNWQYHKMLH